MGARSAKPEMKTRPKVTAFWYRPGNYYRRIILVVVVLALLILIWKSLAPSVSNASFGFLFDATNWDIAFSFLPYTSRDPYWWAFLIGLTNTIGAGVVGIASATTLGFAVGVARSSGNELLGDVGRLYVDVIRNIPVILQAMFWYTVILHFPPAHSSYQVLGSVYLSNRGLYLPTFADNATFGAALVLIILLVWGVRISLRHLHMWRANLRAALMVSIGAATAVTATVFMTLLVPQFGSAFAVDWPTLTGLNFKGGLRISPELAALVAAITVYRGAFISEVFRGGFASVSQGQLDAARSLGLRSWTVLWKIRVPLALISIVPPLSSEIIIIMKVTSIGVVVGFWDLFAISSHSANLTGHSLTVLFTMVLIYIALNYSISAIMNMVNRRVRARGFDFNA